MSGLALPAQPVDATQALNLSIAAEGRASRIGSFMPQPDSWIAPDRALSLAGEGKLFKVVASPVL
jgi:hypothetical protein